MFGRCRRLIFAIAAIMAACAAATPVGAENRKIVVGQPAPDFKVTTFDGKQLTLADFKGQVLVLNFWATWCGPCKRELPLLDTYYKIQEKFGLRVLAVTTEDSVPVERLKPLAAVLTIPMVKRMRGPYDYPDGVPTNYVIDRAGVLRYAKAAAFSLDDLNSILVPMLKEPPPDTGPAASNPVSQAGIPLSSAKQTLASTPAG